MEYDVEFLKGTLKENACDLMGKFKFPHLYQSLKHNT